MSETVSSGGEALARSLRQPTDENLLHRTDDKLACFSVLLCTGTYSVQNQTNKVGASCFKKILYQREALFCPEFKWKKTSCGVKFVLFFRLKVTRTQKQESDPGRKNKNEKKWLYK